MAALASRECRVGPRGAAGLAQLGLAQLWLELLHCVVIELFMNRLVRNRYPKGGPHESGIGVHEESTGSIARARVIAKAPTTPCTRTAMSWSSG